MKASRTGMEYIYNSLKEYKKEKLMITSVIRDDDNGDITHIYFSVSDMVFLIIAPHSGNHYQYLLRTNAERTFDRWSVCDLEKSFDTAGEVVRYFDTEQLRKQLLDYYIDIYLDEDY